MKKLLPITLWLACISVQAAPPGWTLIPSKDGQEVSVSHFQREQVNQPDPADGTTFSIWVRVKLQNSTVRISKYEFICPRKFRIMDFYVHDKLGNVTSSGNNLKSVPEVTPLGSMPDSILAKYCSK